jgi:hypothetical protein
MKNICNVTFFSGAKAQAAVSGGKIATEQIWLGVKERQALHISTKA